MVLSPCWPGCAPTVDPLEEATRASVSSDAGPLRRCGNCRRSAVSMVAGAVPRRPAVISTCGDIAISPLHLARGIQSKVLEAMASGLPGCVTPQSAEGIQAESGRHFEVASSVEEFVRSIVRLSGSRSERLTMGANARQLVEQALRLACPFTQISRIA